MKTPTPDEEILKKLDTEEGRKELGEMMVEPIKRAIGLMPWDLSNQKSKPPKPPKYLVDIKGRKLNVGQHVVFSERAHHTQLMSGTILIVSPKSVYIQKDPEYIDPSKKWKSPKCTKHLIDDRPHQYNRKSDKLDSNYNRIEVCII